jgi:hypothetical protein
MVKLDAIFQELQDIKHRLDEIERMFSASLSQPIFIPESKLLSLPDNIRRSYMIVVSKGKCSATEVSNLSGRRRAIESSYLNQLVRLGWLKKKREGKNLIFSPTI